MNISSQIPFIAGNWKMHMSIPESLELVRAIREAEEEFKGAEVAVIPPFTALSEIKRILQKSSIHLGAQDMFWEKSGAFTGEISAPMLKDAGCKYVLIGHSERRQYFAETNRSVNSKIKAALAHELFPIFCIGESLEEREKGETIQKIESQIIEGLESVKEKEFQRVTIAYEPIWAIGTGLTATPEQAEEVHHFIRHKLAEIYSNETCACAIILYGGSVKPANTFSLLKEKDINGALVGGASLKAESFIEIIKEAIKAYREK